MSIVVDASLAAAWLLPDEGSEATDRVLSAVEAHGGMAPSVFRHELRNIILVAERRRRITNAIGDALLARVAHLPIHDHGQGDDEQIVSLARAFDLTAYDAAYLALALAIGAPLATLDRRLVEAAQARGVPLLGPHAP